MLLLATSTGLAGAVSVEAGRIPVQGSFGVWFKAVRPSGGAEAAPPLVVLHGGPQVPSDYLFDLEKLAEVTDGRLPRSVIFFDQLGCGRSDAPSPDEAEYSVDGSVRDLRTVLSTLVGGERYHLYGQSWGGLLGFEHVSTLDGGLSAASVPTLQPASVTSPPPLQPPLSLTLSNTPSGVQLVEAEAGRLLQVCENDVAAFMAKHNCRVAGNGGEGQPARLAQAYEHAGTSWRGSGAIVDVAADVAAMARVMCPTLCLRGEHDFVTEVCVDGWSGLPDVRFVTLEGCAHHALLEEQTLYLDTLAAFLDEHDS